MKTFNFNPKLFFKYTWKNNKKGDKFNFMTKNLTV